MRAKITALMNDVERKSAQSIRLIRVDLLAYQGMPYTYTDADWISGPVLLLHPADWWKLQSEVALGTWSTGLFSAAPGDRPSLFGITVEVER